MSNFKFIVGQEVKVLSKDRNLNGKTVKIVARGDLTFENGNKIPSHLMAARWYKVTGEGIHESLSFFEDQLSAIS